MYFGTIYVPIHDVSTVLVLTKRHVGSGNEIEVDVDAFRKGIQYTLEKLGKSKSGFERTAVSNFISKRHEGSGNEFC